MKLVMSIIFVFSVSFIHAQDTKTLEAIPQNDTTAIKVVIKDTVKSELKKSETQVGRVYYSADKMKIDKIYQEKQKQVYFINKKRKAHIC